MIRLRSRLVAVLAVGVALAVSTSGCITPEMKRSRALQKQLDATPFPKSLEEVWPEVQKLLAERGYGLVGRDAEAVGKHDPGLLRRLFSPAKETARAFDGTWIMETDWSGERRYRAMGYAEGTSSRIKLRLIREDRTEHGRDGESVRDPDLELELLRRIDPDTAAKVEAAVETPP